MSFLHISLGSSSVSAVLCPILMLLFLLLTRVFVQIGHKHISFFNFVFFSEFTGVKLNQPPVYGIVRWTLL